MGALLIRRLAAVGVGPVVLWSVGCGPANVPQAVFVVPEVTVASPESAQLRESIRSGRLTLSPGGLSVPQQIGLPIQNGDYPLEGVLKFVNNTIDVKTGTVLMEAECPNPKPATGSRQLTPGMFVRVCSGVEVAISR